MNMLKLGVEMLEAGLRHRMGGGQRAGNGAGAAASPVSMTYDCVTLYGPPCTWPVAVLTGRGAARFPYSL